MLPCHNSKYTDIKGRATGKTAAVAPLLGLCRIESNQGYKCLVCQQHLPHRQSALESPRQRLILINTNWINRYRQHPLRPRKSFLVASFRDMA